MEDEVGLVVFKEPQILEVISTYFQTMFSSSGRDSYDSIREFLQPSVSIEQNARLVALPTAEEIKCAVFDINGDKAPGPDGFPASFYHSNWEVIGADVVNEVQSFFQSGNLPRNINRTHIRLIPKVASPRKVADYRPIALCSVHYKIIAKVLTHRLQPLLPGIISENQSAFVKGRAIGDNVLITHEVLHYLSTSKAKKFCSMAVKTDMSKAYDRLEWGFIEAVFLALGFDPIWVGWIMECVRTVSYSFLFNGSACGSVIPSRGIRQGDPLSPYLFILCTEVLSAMCRKSQMDGLMEGVKVSTNGPLINHLLFADDTMFFSRTDRRSVLELKRILDAYESLSGQYINVHKSSIIFASKTPLLQREMVKRVLGIDNVGGVGKYLGLPESFGRRKRDLFSSIVDRIRQRSLSWSNRFLSPAGKKVMLQSVLQSMQAYAMSCFKLPIGLCNRIQSVLTRFWWDSKADKRNISWIAWKKLSLPIDKGGLGFRDIEAFNDSLLAKISWRLINNPECLLARVLLGKYCGRDDFLTVQNVNSASHGWKGILIGRELISRGLGITLGDGSNTTVWGAPWLSFKSSVQAMGPVPLQHQNTLVSTLIQPGSNQWDVDAIEAVIPDHIDDILALVPSRTAAMDRFCWIYNDSGEYTVKSGYWRLMGFKGYELSTQNLREFHWKHEIWRTKTSPKIQMFMWRCVHDAIASKEALLRRQILIDPTCLRCSGLESTTHVLFFCPFALEVWNLVASYRSTVINPNMFIGEIFSTLGRWRNLPPYGVRYPLFPWICWELWKSRNLLTFDATSMVPEEVLCRAIKAGREWEEASLIGDRSFCLRGLRDNWVRPLVFCRVDASLHIANRVVGLGWIFLTEHMEIIHSASITRKGICSVITGEGLALLHAMQDAVLRGYDRVVFQSDSSTLISLLHTSTTHMEVNGILQDIRHLLRSFVYIHFRFIPRSVNGLAHNLAKACLVGIG